LRHLFLILLVLSLGCTTSTVVNFPEGNPVREPCDNEHFLPAISNKYALVIEGKYFSYQGKSQGFVNNREIAEGSIPLEEPYVKNDVEELTQLLLFKGYQVYVIRDKIPTQLSYLLESIRHAANNETQLFIAYSGEGSSPGGLRTAIYQVDSLVISLPGSVIEPDYLFRQLDMIPGTKHLLLNACESGMFVTQAPSDFKGVINTACAEGYSTTPCEDKMHSSLFYGFLRNYSDPTNIYDLGELEIQAGHWTNNFRHKWVDFWNPNGKPISYQVVSLRMGKYPF